MTPDKLPHRIELKINREADDYRDACPNVAPHIAYNAGATAWAPWKVKHVAIESELHGVRAENERLKKSITHLMDVFKMITNMPVPATEEEYMSWFVYVKNMAGGAISEWEAEKYVKQFKDGKGVENEG